MQVKDIMTTEVITVTPDTLVEDIARLLLDNRISGVPVVDTEGKILGIVSEGDLICRSDIDTERSRSWWLTLLSDSRELAADYLKSHGTSARDVMTRYPVTITEDVSIGQAARLLEERRIKRVPVVRDGKLIGIVSRANLLQALATRKTDVKTAATADDRELREQVTAAIARQSWLTHGRPNVIVHDGTVEIWGWVNSAEERRALLLTVQKVPGVQAVEDRLGQMPASLRNV